MHSVGGTGQGRSSERGTVLVFVGVALPVLALFVSLAVDFGHFFDYSRNLQNRVDAAVLAAGTEYGGACFGTPTTAQLNAIGMTGQQYSGPPVGTPDANLPYTFASVAALPGGYQNQPNLNAGTAANLHLVLNASQSWDKGGISFEKGNFCNATYNSPAAPAVDGWLTQANLPLFFPLLNITPTISAHARVELQEAQGESGTSPLVVADPAQTPCVAARVLDMTTGTTTNVVMSKISGNPPTFSGTAAGISPTSGANPHQLSVQAIIPDDCSDPFGGGTTYDALGDGGGINFINTYAPLPATPPATGANVGSVFLTPAGCADSGENAVQSSTPGAAYFFYYTKGICHVTVNAQVDFPGNAFDPNFGVVFDMFDTDGTKHTVTANTGTLDSSGHQLWSSTFTIPPQSGRHTFKVSYFDGTTGKTGCPNASNACPLSGGAVLQETFAAWDDPTGSGNPTDSGPISQMQIGSSVGGVVSATGGVNTLAQGSSTDLVVSFQLRGLAFGQPGDPPLVLRTSVKNSKKTGFIDCGQGNGAGGPGGLESALASGCPHSLQIYTGPSCPPATTGTIPWSCLAVVPGNKAGPMKQAMDDRVGSSCDFWKTYPGTGISVDDPRRMVMVITAPGDLSGSAGSGVVRVLGFASFYVTGYDGDNDPSNTCASPTDQNEANPFPTSGGGNQFDIWGHFIQFVSTTGTSNGQSCNPNIFNDCVAALTR